MKKLIALAIAALFLIPAISFADDRVTLSGSYELYAYDMENYGNDFSDTTSADEDAYFYQRFRLVTSIKAADDVAFTVRCDINEGSWGADFADWVVAVRAPNSVAGHRAHQVHWDKVYVDVMKDMYDLRVGSQPFVYGNLINEGLANGIKLTVKTPIKIVLDYAKTEEGGDLADNVLANDDEDLYGITVAYAADAGSIQGFFVTLKDDNSQYDISVLGIQGKTTVGPVSLNGEVNFFGGSDDTTNVDNEGKQVFLEGRMNISEAWMVGLQLFWAEGNNDATEEQVHCIGDLDDFIWTDYGVMWTWLEPIEHAFEVDDEAGSEGIQLITDFQATEDILLQGSIGYFQPEEDAVTFIDSMLIFNASIKYNFCTNGHIGLQYNYISPDTDAGFDDDAAHALMGVFAVSF